MTDINFCHYCIFHFNDILLAEQLHKLNNWDFISLNLQTKAMCVSLCFRFSRLWLCLNLFSWASLK